MTANLKEIFKDGIRYVPSKVAAQNVGLVPDYISRMCRFGYVRAIRHAGVWYVDEDSLLVFLKEQEGEYELFKQRKSLAGKELRRHRSVPDKRHAVITRPHPLLRLHAKKHRTNNNRMQHAIAFVVAFTFFATTGFALEMIAPRGSANRAAIVDTITSTGNQVAAISSLPFIDSTATAVYKTFCPYIGACAKEESLSDYLAERDPLLSTKTTTVAPAKPAAPTPTRTPVTTTVQNITQPVIERITTRVVTEGGISETLLDARLYGLEQKLTSQILALGGSNPSSVTQVFETASNLARIEHLDELDLTDPTISNATITGGTISGLSSPLPIGSGGTGTSTAPTSGKILVGNSSGGYDLTATSSLGITADVGFGNTWDISNSALAPTSTIGILVNASSTIGDGTDYGGLTIFGGATTTSLRITSLPSALLTTNATGLLVSTSSLGVAYGGTGLTSIGNNQLLLGNSSGGFTAVATSSLGFVSSVQRDWQISNSALSPTTTLGIGVYASSTIGSGSQTGGLTIFGGATTTGWFLAQNSTDSTTGFQIKDADGGAPVFNVDTTNEFVGIGTTSPTAALSVNGGGIFSGAATGVTLDATLGYSNVRIKGGTSNPRVIFDEGSAGSVFQLDSNGGAFRILSDDSLLASFTETGNLSLHTNGGQRLTIDSSGNVGIGTTSPATLLSLAGTSGIFASTTATSTFQGGGINLLTAAGNTGCFAINGTCLPTLSLINGETFKEWSVQGNGYLAPTTTRGILVNASSTIGAGAQATGLTISGGATTTGNLVVQGTGTTTIAGSLAVETSGLVYVASSNRIGIGTVAPTTGLDVDVATDISGDLTISGGSTLTVSATGPINQTGTGQVTFAGNVDATNGLDVTTANFTVGGSNFTVAPGTGNTSLAGTFAATGAATLGSTLKVTGAVNASSTLQVDGASRFYSTLQTDGALTAAGSGTGLSVTNNASVGGTLSVTGTASAASMSLTSGTLSLATQKITGLATPTVASDAANKSYVDSVAQGLSLKESVRAGTTANITLSGEQTIDGVSLVASDRVLVKNQTDATTNGIYVVAGGSWSRSTDADTDAEVTSGMFTFVEEGTVNASSGWVLTTADPITLGVSLLTFTQFSGAGQIEAGTGMTKSGNTLNVEGTANRITANADSIDISSSYVGQSSITTTGILSSGSIGSGFGSINIGSNSLTAGSATFTNIVGSAITGTGNLSITGNGSFSGTFSVAGATTLATTTFSGDVAMSSKKITGLADPTSAQEAATKAYVDAVAQGLSVKASVRVATTTNVTLSGEQTIDGVAAVAGNRVLLMGQSTGSQNGIYVVASGAWSRSSDANENSEVVSGMFTFVEEGTANANTGWALITANPITLDSTTLTFTQFSGSGDVTAGDGLTKSGTTINAVGTTNRISVTADAIDISSSYVGQGSITTVGTLTSGSIASGFGNINIGASTLAAGESTFATTTSFGDVAIGRTSTTTIQGDGATSTFAGGISLASGNVNLATGGNFLVNNALILNSTTLGSTVVSSSLTSVGGLDSGSITTGFGDINIGANTLGAGTTTITNLIVQNTSTSTFAGPIANASGDLFLGGFSSSDDIILNRYGGNVGIGTTSPYAKLSVVGPVIAEYFHATSTSASTFAGGLLSLASTTIGSGTQAGGLTVSGGATTTGNAYFAGNVGIGTTTPNVKFEVEKSGTSYNSDTTYAARFGTVGKGVGFGYDTTLDAGVISALHSGVAWKNLVINPNGGSVGIGVTAPTNKLVLPNDQYLAWRNAANNNETVGVKSGTSDDLQLTTGGSVKLTITSAGSVGIGTTTPWGKLSVTNTGSGPSFIVEDDTSPDSTPFIIDASGNVGIGTAAPSTKLHIGTEVSDDNNYAYDSNALMVVHQTPTASATLNDPKTVLMLARQGTASQAYGAAAAFNVSRYENSDVASRTRLDISLAHASFDPTSNTVMTFLSSGNVGIGTTTPQQKLVINGSGSETQLRISNSNGSNDSSLFLTDDVFPAEGLKLTYDSSVGDSYFNNIYTGSTNAFHFQSSSFNPGGADLMTIQTGGNVGIGTTTPQWLLNPTSASASQLSLSAGAGVAQWAFRNAGGDLFLATTTVAGTATTSTSALTLMGASGKVGIATTTPLDLLSIYNNPTAGGIGLGASSNYNGISLDGGGATNSWNFLSSASDRELYIRANSTNSIRFQNSSSADLMTIRTGGNVGIGTTTSNWSLQVASATPYLAITDTDAGTDLKHWLLSNTDGMFRIGTSSDQLSATSSLFTINNASTTLSRSLFVTGTGTSTFAGGGVNISSGCFAINNTCLSTSGGSVTGTTGQVAYLSGTDTAVGTSTLFISTASRVGIGTTTPWRKLSITDAVSTAQQVIAQDQTNYTGLLTNSVGDFTLDPSGGDVQITDDSLWVCTGGCPATASGGGSGQLIIDTGGEIGVGTTSPREDIHIEGDNPRVQLFDNTEGAISSARPSWYVGQSEANFEIGTTTNYSSYANVLSIVPNTTGAMATSTFRGDIAITGKLDVSTIDPPYTIDGVKYATYVPAMTGVKEETVATIQLDAFNNRTGKYEYVIPFDNVEEGSDVWLFYQVTNFGDRWENLIVQLTPAFDGQVFYTKNIAQNTLTISGSEQGEVSMRLTSDRYDAERWLNLRPDQDGNTEGTHVISAKKPKQEISVTSGLPAAAATATERLSDFATSTIELATNTLQKLLSWLL